MKKKLIISTLVLFPFFLILLKPYLGLRLLSYVPISEYQADKFELVFDEEEKDHLDSLRAFYLKKGIIYPKPKYSKARIIYRGDSQTVKMRFKGDWVAHLKHDNFSFRLKSKKNILNTKYNKLNFHHPAERNYLSEYVYHLLLKQEGVNALDYNFIEVKMNEKDYLYAFEGNVDESYLEKHNASSVYKLNEKSVFEDAEGVDSIHFKNSTVKSRKINKGKIKEQRFKKIISSSDSIKKYFDIDNAAKFLVLAELMGAQHNLRWHNLKFLEKDGKLFFIGNDAQPIYYPNSLEDKTLPVFKQFFEIEAFKELYKKYRDNYFDEKYFSKFLIENYFKIESRKKLLSKYYPNADLSLWFVFANIDESQIYN